MGINLSFLLACCNPSLNQDKEYLIYVTKTNKGKLVFATAYGPRNRLGKLGEEDSFDYKKLVSLVKSKYKKGYVLKKVDGIDCLTSTLTLKDFIEYLDDGLEKIGFKNKKSHVAEITSNPLAILCNCIETPFDYSPIW